MEQLNTRIITRNDSIIDWDSIGADVVLLRGEEAYAFDENGRPHLKVGDGFTKWSELPYFTGEGGGGSSTSQFFEVEKEDGEDDITAINRVTGSAILSVGDVAVVKNAIADGNYSYTGYIYNGKAWTAMDGNYNAENVYFDEDLETTSAIGNITLTNGMATIPTTGKNLKEVWETIFIKEKNPTTTKPSVKIAFIEAGVYEVGETVSPSYSISLNEGKYSFNTSTGVTLSSISVTDTAGNSSTEASGTFEDVLVEDGVEYTITATAEYSDGIVPTTNRGNEYPAGQIKAGSASKTSAPITGYRNAFWGTLEEKADVSTIDSAYIRSLAHKSGKAFINGEAFDIEIPVGAMRIVLAYPATLQDVTSIKDVNGLSAPVTGSFTKYSVQVNGANDLLPIEYKVYVMDRATAATAANTYNVVI